MLHKEKSLIPAEQAASHLPRPGCILGIDHPLPVVTQTQRLLFAFVKQAQGLATCRGIGIKIGGLGQRSYTSAMAGVSSTIVPACVVDRDSSHPGNVSQLIDTARNATNLLSHRALVLGVHLKRNCMSTFLSNTSYR